MISTILLASILSVAGDGKVSTEDLVRRLGDKSFRVRDASARELLARGKEAVNALKRGADNADSRVTLDSIAAFHRSVALKTPPMAHALGKDDDPLRRLFVAWLEREPD